MKCFLSFLLALIPSIAWGQCAGGLLANCPPAVNPQATDLLYGWQFGQTPHSRSFTVQQIGSSFATLPFASPPPLGNVTPNQVFATTLHVVGPSIFNGGTFSGTWNGALNLNGTGTALNVTGNTMLGGTTIFGPSLTDLHTAWTLVCPIANCPVPLSVATGVLSQAATTGGSNLAEFAAVEGLYVNTGQPNGQKVTRYIGAVQGPLGGSTWTLNTDVVRNGIPNGPSGQVGSSSPGTPGAIPSANSTIGYELDFSNWDQDSTPGVGPFTVGEYIHVQSKFQSLAGIYYDSNPLAGNFGWTDGLMFTGAKTVSDNTIYDSTSSTFSYQIGGTHAGASILDVSTSPTSLEINGSHSNASIWDHTTSPTGMLIAGTHANNGIWITSPGVFGIQIQGADTSAFYANDTGQYGFQSNGTHTVADIWASDSAPTVLKVTGSHTNLVEATGATITGNVYNGAFSALTLGATGALAGAQWQAQGAYVGWNYSPGTGQTNFINSRGAGVGGFTWYNVDSSAGATPALLATLSATGNFSTSSLTVTGAVSMGGLLTSCVGQPTGQLWNNGNVVSICP